MFVATTKYLKRFAAGFHSGNVTAEMARTTARATPAFFTTVRMGAPSDLHSPAEQYGYPPTWGTPGRQGMRLFHRVASGRGQQTEEHASNMATGRYIVALE